jgi:hypothetical protein
VLLILDKACDQIHDVVGLYVLGREHPVVRHERHAADDQIPLQRHHLEYVLRAGEPVPLEDEDSRDRRIGLRVSKELEKPGT